MPAEISKKSSGPPEFLSAYKSGVRVRIKVQPGASRSRIVGVHGEALKIALQAPPVDGKANTALIEFLAKSLGLPKRRIELLGGETSRDKAVFIDGLSLAKAIEDFTKILG